MTLEDFATWLREQNPGSSVTVGGVDDKEKRIGVYPGRGKESQRICIGGPSATGYQTKHVIVLIRWNKSMTQSEEQANVLYGQLYGLANTAMGKAKVISVDPGGEPTFAGRSLPDGVCEFIIEAEILYERTD